MLFLGMRQRGILFAHVFFGFWLFLPGPPDVPVEISAQGVLGIRMLIAAGAYLMDAITPLLFPSFPTIGQFTFIGELLFPLWLVIKGANVERWRQLTAA